jgi:hypothetical protein
MAGNGNHSAHYLTGVYCNPIRHPSSAACILRKSQGQPDEDLSDRNPARSSATNNSRCSQVAKCPPLSSLL